MKNYWIWLPTAIFVASFMELWAAVLHRWFWHGPMWSIHRSHHAPKGKWEANDALSILHAPMAIVLIVYGNEAAPSIFREIAFGIGIGMTAFGAGYVIVHDGLVHGRLPVQWLSKLSYFSKIRDYHLLHHDNSAKGVPFGLFLGPLEHGLLTGSMFLKKKERIAAKQSR